MQNTILSGKSTLRVLALDTSTNVLSLGVGVWLDGAAEPQCWLHTGQGAAQSSGSMIAAVQNLLHQADCALLQLDAIVFGAGPGSFTGLRTACAVAQGLALGANVPVLPMNTLQAVAEDWRMQHQPTLAEGTEVWSLLDARMHEMYASSWRWQPVNGLPAWQPVHADCLVAPEQVALLPELQHAAVRVGNVQAEYGAVLPWPVDSAMPTAAAMLRLAPVLLQQGHAIDPALALPRYVRDKVAQTTAEREAAKAAAQ